MNAAVVGGGLAGLAAALELADQGHAVTLYEARPTLGGAVQTLPEREGDPSPPPDNGQHIALGCFTEYLRFLDRIGEGALLPPPPARAAGDRRGRPRGDDRALGPARSSATATSRSATGSGCARGTAPRRSGSATQTFGALLRELGCSDESIDSFWDVFVRPALNLRTDEVSAEWGVFTVRTALLAARDASDVLLPRGRWAGCTATPPAGRSRRPAHRSHRRARRVARRSRRRCRSSSPHRPPRLHGSSASRTRRSSTRRS